MTKALQGRRPAEPFEQSDKIPLTFAYDDRTVVGWLELTPMGVGMMERVAEGKLTLSPAVLQAASPVKGGTKTHDIVLSISLVPVITVPAKED